MSDVDRLNKALQAHSDELMRLSMEYQDLAVVAVHKRNAYDIAKSRTLMIVRTDETMAKWTVPVQGAYVTKICENVMVDARIAESMLDACKTRLRAVEASLSAVQSQARLMKTEAEATRYQT